MCWNQIFTRKKLWRVSIWVTLLRAVNKVHRTRAICCTRKLSGTIVAQKILTAIQYFHCSYRWFLLDFHTATATPLFTTSTYFTLIVSLRIKSSLLSICTLNTLCQCCWIGPCPKFHAQSLRLSLFRKLNHRVQIKRTLFRLMTFNHSHDESVSQR